MTVAASQPTPQPVPRLAHRSPSFRAPPRVDGTARPSLTLVPSTSPMFPTPAPSPAHSCDTPPAPGRARLLCDLVRLAVDGVAEIAEGEVGRLVGCTPRGLQHRRQAGMYLAHVVFSVRTTDVARGFGRDTTTVYHAYRQVEDMRDVPAFDAFLDAVEAIVTGAAALADEAD